MSVSLRPAQPTCGSRGGVEKCAGGRREGQYGRRCRRRAGGAPAAASAARRAAALHRSKHRTPRCGQPPRLMCVMPAPASSHRHAQSSRAVLQQRVAPLTMMCVMPPSPAGTHRSRSTLQVRLQGLGGQAGRGRQTMRPGQGAAGPASTRSCPGLSTPRQRRKQRNARSSSRAAAAARQQRTCRSARGRTPPSPPGAR